MKTFNGNIEDLTLENKYYRRVLTTTPTMQLVLMSLPPGTDIGMETHPATSQFIRVEAGTGEGIVNRTKYSLVDGDVLVIPPGAKHNIINTDSNQDLKLYAIYSPPEHAPRTRQLRKPKQHEH